MGKRFQDLKKENEELRQALAAKFVAHRIQPGTLVVLKADQNALVPVSKVRRLAERTMFIELA